MTIPARVERRIIELEGIKRRLADEIREATENTVMLKASVVTMSANIESYQAELVEKDEEMLAAEALLAEIRGVVDAYAADELANRSAADECPEEVEHPPLAEPPATEIKLIDQVLKTLKTAPRPLRGGEIADHLGVLARRVAPTLAALRRDGLAVYEPSTREGDRPRVRLWKASVVA